MRFFAKNGITAPNALHQISFEKRNTERHSDRQNTHTQHRQREDRQTERERRSLISFALHFRGFGFWPARGGQALPMAHRNNKYDRQLRCLLTTVLCFLMAPLNFTKCFCDCVMDRMLIQMQMQPEVPWRISHEEVLDLISRWEINLC